MFQWRWKLRQARQAIDDERFDEASRLLADPQLQEFLPAKRLAEELAERFASRAAERIATGRSSAGFKDMAIAEQLGARSSHTNATRQAYCERVVSEATRQLIAGNYTEASEEAHRAARRGASDRALRRLDEIATLCQAAEKSAGAGDMGLALDQFCRALRLADVAEPTPLSKALTRQVDALKIRSQEHAAARTQMHQAVADDDWSAALRGVESIVRLAPHDPQASAVRRRAWKKLGMEATRAYDGKQQPPAPVDTTLRRRAAAKSLDVALRKSQRASTHHPRSEHDTVNGQPPIDRRMLWIDSVGALLVCLDDQIVLGQPAGEPGTGPAVPILADLSRRHAIIRREAGRYVLQPLGKVRIDRSEVSETTVLPDQCIVELGEGVRFRFEKPHALSATARLTPESGHRLSPPADAVLLMADSCVLGPAAHCHVRCRGWTDDVVLFRQQGELFCRSKQPLVVDGVQQTGTVPLAGNPRIEGQDFALTVEDPDKGVF